MERVVALKFKPIRFTLSKNNKYIAYAYSYNIILINLENDQESCYEMRYLIYEEFKCRNPDCYFSPDSKYLVVPLGVKFYIIDIEKGESNELLTEGDIRDLRCTNDEIFVSVFGILYDDSCDYYTYYKYNYKGEIIGIIKKWIKEENRFGFNEDGEYLQFFSDERIACLHNDKIKIFYDPIFKARTIFIHTILTNLLDEDISFTIHDFLSGV
jgi:hypothetical protein